MTALPLVLPLLLVDLAVLALCPLIIGCIIIEERREWPFSWTFVKGIWL